MDTNVQSSLFEPSDSNNKANATYRPLAIRMRPESLNQVIGQEHILGDSNLLPSLIQSNQFGSLLFYGPPGCGKTTLAHVIAQETKSKCVAINAVLSNVAELRDILKLARYQPEQQTLLFIDEIHRFNKAQQDLLLPDVEAGHIRLIGATTHNPGFYINAPLLSRSHLFRLEPLGVQAIIQVLKRAMADKANGLASTGCTLTEDVFEKIAQISDGDTRKALNALETIVLSQPIRSKITESAVKAFASERQIRYDANEDEHYDTISAYIKSIRGCDPDAALYWLAKMLEGGEDPRFIARRLVILASEDVGLADSRALPLAVSAFQACEIIGMPECALNLSHVTVFLATAPKSNSTYLAVKAAQEAIQKGPIQRVPKYLRDAKNKVGKSLGHGDGYLYSHNYPEAISGQEYMEQPLQFYHPKPIGSEASIFDRLKVWKNLKNKQL